MNTENTRQSRKAAQGDPGIYIDTSEKSRTVGGPYSPRNLGLLDTHSPRNLGQLSEKSRTVCVSNNGLR